jgi:hypothetical protein
MGAGLRPCGKPPDPNLVCAHHFDSDRLQVVSVKLLRAMRLASASVLYADSSNEVAGRSDALLHWYRISSYELRMPKERETAQSVGPRTKSQSALDVSRADRELWEMCEWHTKVKSSHSAPSTRF